MTDQKWLKWGKTDAERELNLLKEIADAAHDAVKSFPMKSLYQWKDADEPLTDEQLRDSRLSRLHEALDEELEWSNREKTVKKCDHPPIPPNCNRFRMDHNEINISQFFRSDGDAGRWISIDFLLATSQYDCAAVARCAWLDEVREYDAGNRGPTHYGGDRVSQRWCEQIAEAWRKWGRGEAWES